MIKEATLTIEMSVPAIVISNLFPLYLIASSAGNKVISKNNEPMSITPAKTYIYSGTAIIWEPVTY